MITNSVKNFSNLPAFGGSKKTESKKDHFGRNLAISAGVGAGTCLGLIKLAESACKNEPKILVEDPKLKLFLNSKAKTAFAIVGIITGSIYYLAGRAVKYKDEEDKLGRNILITSALGAVAGKIGLYHIVHKTVSTKIYRMPKELYDGLTEATSRNKKSAIAGAYGLSLYYLAGKGLVDKIKGEKLFGAQRVSD